MSAFVDDASSVYDVAALSRSPTCCIREAAFDLIYDA